MDKILSINTIKNVFSALGAKTSDSNYGVYLGDMSNQEPKGIMSMANLASVLGVNNSFLTENISVGNTLKIAWDGTTNPSCCLLGTSGLVGTAQSAAIVCGYGGQDSRNKGKVLISGDIYYIPSNTTHAIYVQNNTPQPLHFGMIVFRGSNPTLTLHTTSAVESDFSTRFD